MQTKVYDHEDFSFQYWRDFGVDPENQISSIRQNLLDYYFERVKTFWNFFVIKATKKFETVETEEDFKAFRAEMEQLYDDVVNRGVVYSGWETLLSDTAELSPEVLRYRFEDLIRAYEVSRQSVLVAIPSTKTAYSSNSIAFLIRNRNLDRTESDRVVIRVNGTNKPLTALRIDDEEISNWLRIHQTESKNPDDVIGLLLFTKRYTKVFRGEVVETQNKNPYIVKMYVGLKNA